jgi:hypothetical protein
LQVVEDRAQLLTRPVQAGPNGSDRDAKGSRGLGQCEQPLDQAQLDRLLGLAASG